MVPHGIEIAIVMQKAMALFYAERAYDEID